MILTRIQMWLAGAAAFVVTVLGIYLKGRASGVRAEQDKHTRRRLDAMKTAKEVEDEVEILDDHGLSRRASDWVRTKDER